MNDDNPHNNTKPSNGGSFSLSEHGKIIYWPIEPGALLKPSYALLLVEKPNGDLVAQIDMKDTYSV